MARPRKPTTTNGINVKNPLHDMPDEIAAWVELMSPTQRRYAEYRARGLSQPDAALKAGSKGQTRDILGRVGYNMEASVKGLPEYIIYLQKKVADAAMLTTAEIIENLRDVYKMAMRDGKYAEANKAMELLGNHLNMYKQQGRQQTTEAMEEISGRVTKNNVSPFKEEGGSVEETKKKLGNLLKDL